MHRVSDSTAPTNAARVHAALRQAIIDGEFVPGERLRAEALAERFGTSRTPVREALLLMEREGLVEVSPNRGAMVRPFDSADLTDLYEVRAVLEPYAAARAATRIDADALRRLHEICDLAEARGGASPEAIEDQLSFNDEFHSVIAAAAGSPRLLAARQSVAGIPWSFRASFWANDEQRAQSLFCHRELVGALERGRSDLAEAVMRMHMLGAHQFLLSLAAGPDEDEETSGEE
jgi:DNA-binding GntR family transcriptional regulator